MLPLMLPHRGSLSLSDAEARALYDALWQTPGRRGSLTAAGSVSHAIMFKLGRPLAFDREQADAVSEALARLGI